MRVGPIFLGHKKAACEAVDLPLALAHALTELDPESPSPMGELANKLHCDASNVTGIVDRLEARGLVGRGSSTDRRQKVLVLTSEGKRQRRRLLAKLEEPPAILRSLSEADHRALASVLRKLPSPAEF
jgi:DNA-binding MarR family transcriptional regulator